MKIAELLQMISLASNNNESFSNEQRNLLIKTDCFEFEKFKIKKNYLDIHTKLKEESVRNLHLFNFFNF